MSRDLPPDRWRRFSKAVVHSFPRKGPVHDCRAWAEEEALAQGMGRWHDAVHKRTTRQRRASPSLDARRPAQWWGTGTVAPRALTGAAVRSGHTVHTLRSVATRACGVPEMIKRKGANPKRSR